MSLDLEYQKAMYHSMFAQVRFKNLTFETGFLQKALILKQDEAPKAGSTSLATVLLNSIGYFDDGKDFTNVSRMFFIVRGIIKIISEKYQPGKK